MSKLFASFVCFNVVLLVFLFCCMVVISQWFGIPPNCLVKTWLWFTDLVAGWLAYLVGVAIGTSTMSSFL